MGWADLIAPNTPFSQFVASNRGKLGQIGAGLGSGQNFSAGLSNAAQAMPQGQATDDAYATQQAAEAERARGMNATLEFMRSKGYDDLVSGVEGGGLDMGTAWGEALKRSAPAAAPDPFTLGKGETRYDGMGNPIASGPAGSPDTVVNNNIGGSDKFYDTMDAKLAEQTAAAIDTGMSAQSNNIRLGELERILTTAPQGTQGAMVQAAGSLGLPVSGLDDVQAAQAIINQMVPGQRPPGAGTMSDADLDLYKKSLPSIINQPGGNQKIVATMRAINEYTIAQAQIAQKVANREISPAEGRALQAQVPNPLARTAAPAAPAGNVDSLVQKYGY